MVSSTSWCETAETPDLGKNPRRALVFSLHNAFREPRAIR
jgi:hypothetical protein